MAALTNITSMVNTTIFDNNTFTGPFQPLTTSEYHGLTTSEYQVLTTSEYQSLTTSEYPVLEPEYNFTAEEYEPYKQFMMGSRHWVQKVLVHVVLLIGLVGNTVTMMVLTRPRMRSSTNTYLTALAMSDLLYLLSVFSLSLQHHPALKESKHWVYWHYCKYAYWIADASSSTSIWLTVTFTIERYVAVCLPIYGKMMCTVGRARLLTVTVFVFCFVLTATTPHEWQVTTLATTNATTNITSYSMKLEESQLGRDELYRHSYYWFNAVMFILLPLALLAIFNIILIRAVHSKSKARLVMTQERKTRGTDQENRITVMLIAVVVLALFCQLPSAVLLLYSAVKGPPAPRTPAFAVTRGLGNIFNLLNAVNAAVNFVLYSAFSAKYRRTFLRMFVPCVYKLHHSPHSMYNGGDFDAMGGMTVTESCTFRERMSFRRRGNTTNSLKVEYGHRRSSYRRPSREDGWQSRRHSSFCNSYSSGLDCPPSSSNTSKRFTFDPEPAMPSFRPHSMASSFTIPDIKISQSAVTSLPSSIEDTSFSSPRGDDHPQQSGTEVLDAMALLEKNSQVVIDANGREE